MFSIIYRGIYGSKPGENGENQFFAVFVNNRLSKWKLCREWKVTILWDLVGSPKYICCYFITSGIDLGVKTGGKRGLKYHFFAFFVKKDCRNLKLCMKWRKINLWDLVGSLDYICGLFDNFQRDLGVKTGGKRGYISIFCLFVKKTFEILNCAENEK